jgi:hypothetical protein
MRGLTKSAIYWLIFDYFSLFFNDLTEISQSPVCVLKGSWYLCSPIFEQVYKNKG